MSDSIIDLIVMVFVVQLAILDECIPYIHPKLKPLSTPLFFRIVLVICPALEEQA